MVGLCKCAVADSIKNSAFLGRREARFSFPQIPVIKEKPTTRFFGYDVLLNNTIYREMPKHLNKKKIRTISLKGWGNLLTNQHVAVLVRNKILTPPVPIFSFNVFPTLVLWGREMMSDD